MQAIEQQVKQKLPVAVRETFSLVKAPEDRFIYVACFKSPNQVYMLKSKGYYDVTFMGLRLVVTRDPVEPAKYALTEVQTGFRMSDFLLPSFTDADVVKFLSNVAIKLYTKADQFSIGLHEANRRRGYAEVSLLNIVTLCFGR